MFAHLPLSDILQLYLDNYFNTPELLSQACSAIDFRSLMFDESGDTNLIKEIFGTKQWMC